MRRVLVVVDAIELTGPLKGLIQFFSNCSGMLDSTCLAYFSYSKESPYWLTDARRIVDDCVRIDGRRGAFFLELWRLARLARSQRVNLVQSHSFKAHVTALFISRVLRIPWIAFAHGWTFEDRRVRIYNWLERHLLKLPDCVIAVNDEIRQDLHGTGRNRPCVVVRNAADNLPITKEQIDAARDIRRSWHLDDRHFVIAVVGRLSYEKGQDILLRAVAQLSTEEFCPVVVIVGSGRNESKLIALAQELGIEDRVIFSGHVKHSIPYMLASDVVCIPSRSEGIPNVLLEAVALKVPLIASRVGGIPSVLGEDSIAIFEPLNVRQLSEKLGAMIGDRTIMERIVIANTEAAKRMPTKEERANQIVVYYDNVLEAAEE